MLLYPASPLGRDPFAAMRRLHEEIERAFAPIMSDAGRAAYPAVNMWQGEQSIALTTELPGVAPTDIELAAKDDTLTISGERKMPEVGDRAVWHRRERPFGKFTRTIELPFRIDPDKIEARFHNGVLEIELQRPEEDRPRRIAVKAA